VEPGTDYRTLTASGSRAVPGRGNRQRKLKGERKRSLLEVGIAMDERSRQQREYDDIEGDWEISAKQMMFRLNKTAKQLIENVGKGRFPQHNARG